MPNVDDKNLVTTDVMRAYISVLEKQVQQMTLVVTTLEELNDKLEKVEGHFHNGFKSEITNHISEQNAIVMDKMEKALTTIYIIKDYVARGEGADKELGEKAYNLTNEIKEKIGGLKSDVVDLKSAIKIDRATNLIGLGTFVVGILTIILKMFGKI